MWERERIVIRGDIRPSLVMRWQHRPVKPSSAGIPWSLLGSDTVVTDREAICQHLPGGGREEVRGWFQSIRTLGSLPGCNQTLGPVLFPLIFVFINKTLPTRAGQGRGGYSCNFSCDNEVVTEGQCSHQMFVRTMERKFADLALIQSQGWASESTLLGGR